MIELKAIAPGRWVKRIWFINGVAVFALVIVGLGALALLFVSDWRGNREVAVAAPAAGASINNDRVRAVRFDIPATVRGTSTRLVVVRNGAGELHSTASGIGSVDEYEKSRRGGNEGPMVNIIFLAPGNAQGRLLFERPAYLSSVVYPGAQYNRADSLQTWITYQAVLTDTNGDGKLDDDDDEQLLISDLDGNNLRRVLPDGWRLKEVEGLGDHKTLIVTAYELPKRGEGKFDEHRALERAFTYDVPGRKLEPLNTLDSLVARAGRVVLGWPAR